MLRFLHDFVCCLSWLLRFFPFCLSVYQPKYSSPVVPVALYWCSAKRTESVSTHEWEEEKTLTFSCKNSVEWGFRLACRTFYWSRIHGNLKPVVPVALYWHSVSLGKAYWKQCLVHTSEKKPPWRFLQKISGMGVSTGLCRTFYWSWTCGPCRFAMYNFCVQCLCLAPTYELALQIGEVIEKMSKHMTGLRLRYATRGERGEMLCTASVEK